MIWHDLFFFSIVNMIFFFHLIFTFSLSFFTSRTYDMHDSHIDLKFIGEKEQFTWCATMLYTTIYIYYLTIYPPHTHLHKKKHQIHFILFLDAQISPGNVTNVKYSSTSKSNRNSSSMVEWRNLCKYDGRMFTLRYMNSDVILIVKGVFATIEFLRLI